MIVKMSYFEKTRQKVMRDNLKNILLFALKNILLSVFFMVNFRFCHNNFINPKAIVQFDNHLNTVSAVYFFLELCFCKVTNIYINSYNSQYVIPAVKN